MDPLGTGKIKPYVDKKFFFQDLKNPPKKVLKELSSSSGQEVGFAANFLDRNEDDSQLFETKNSINLDKSLTDDKIDEKPNSSILQGFPDPFANTTIDPFLEDDDFSKVSLDSFEFSFNSNGGSKILPETIISDEVTIPSYKKHHRSVSEDSNDVFNGPLQVTLPPETWTSINTNKKTEQINSEVILPSTNGSTVRSRPSGFKQNTVDVISSISSKKMKPHIFSQKFSKRDNNSINMRRLQESDSLSENETAPEPPPRPDTGSSYHHSPPPLPPKKQFSDIVIRPSSARTNSNSKESSRYDYIAYKNRSQSQNESSPPLPLPCKKVGKTDGVFTGPGRPSKKTEEDGYLTPVSIKNEMPILLPPPQRTGSKSRILRKHEIVSEQKSVTPEPLISDITLSQLLTLGIDDLAVKLRVPKSKLSTMTLVELTTYLTDFLEFSKKKPSPQPKKKSNEAKFIVKFDDNFGEEQIFVADFEKFNSMPESSEESQIDRYAVFREIIGVEPEDEIQTKDNFFKTETNPVVLPPKFDTKITQQISKSKDRYAALRDIILSEDLFEKPNPALFASTFDEIEIETEKDETEFIDENSQHDSSDNSPEIYISQESNQIEENEIEREEPEILISNSGLGACKDDLEIDEYMKRAISNLSLDNRDHLSPKSPIVQNASTSPIRLQNNLSPTIKQISELNVKLNVNDMSTSPIPLNKSPLSKSPNQRLSPRSIMTSSQSPIPELQEIPDSENPSPNNSSSLNGGAESSPEIEENIGE